MIELPNNMSKVPTETFMGCSKLEEVNWNHKLQEIGIRAFNACKSLKQLRFSENLKIINTGAFYDVLKTECWWKKYIK